MAKAITQETVDKAVMKAVAAEQKRIISVIKADEELPRVAKTALIAAIKADSEPS